MGPAVCRVEVPAETRAIDTLADPNYAVSFAAPANSTRISVGKRRTWNLQEMSPGLASVVASPRRR